MSKSGGSDDDQSYTSSCRSGREISSKSSKKGSNPIAVVAEAVGDLLFPKPRKATQKIPIQHLADADQSDEDSDQSPDKIPISLPAKTVENFWDYTTNDFKKKNGRPIPYVSYFEPFLLSHHKGLILGINRGFKKFAASNYYHGALYFKCTFKNVDEEKGKVPCKTKFLLHFKKPKQEQPVKFAIKIVDNFGHVIDPDRCLNTRQLRGARREALRAEVISAPPVNVVERLYRDMTAVDVQENIAPVGRNVISMIKSETKRQFLFDRNALTDLHLRKEHYRNIDTKSQILPGYIHLLEKSPFNMIMVSEIQLKKTMELAKERGGLTCHFDATGSILTKLKTMPTKKKVYLYTLCTEGFAKGTTLNLFDFLTESHTFPDIKSKLAFYNSYLNDMQDSEPQQIKPITRIVTDLSYALIKACIGSFNGNMNLKTYLSAASSIILDKQCENQGNQNRRQPYIECVISLCYAHLMKAFSNLISKHKIDDKIRRAALFFFASMIRATTFTQFWKVFDNFIAIFASCKMSGNLRDILNNLRDIDDDELQMNEDDETRQEHWENWADAMETRKGAPLRDCSPFHAECKRKYDAAIFDQYQDGDETEDNPWKCNKVIDLFLKVYAPIIPLYAEAALLKLGNFKVLTNGRVEGRFKKIKESVMGSTRMHPGQFCENLLKETLGNWEKSELESKKLKRMPSQTQGEISTIEKEVWSRKKKSKTGFYGSQNPTTANTLEIFYDTQSFIPRDGCYFLFGSTHQGNVHVYSQNTAGKQCTSNAVISLIMSTKIPFSIWNRSTLDAVMRIGDNFCQILINSKPELNDSLVSVEDVVGKIPLACTSEISNQQYTFSLVPDESYFGLLEPQISNDIGWTRPFSDSIKQCMNEDNAMAILINNGKSYALKRIEKFLYFVDTHSRTTTMKIAPNGKSVVAKLPLELAISRLHSFLQISEKSGLADLDRESRLKFELTKVCINARTPESSPITTQENNVILSETEKDSEDDTDEENRCWVCSQEYFGDHRCKTCGKRVHAFCGDTNSEDEGFAGKVICNLCLCSLGNDTTLVDAEDNSLEELASSISSACSHETCDKNKHSSNCPKHIDDLDSQEERNQLLLDPTVLAECVAYVRQPDKEMPKKLQRLNQLTTAARLKEEKKQEKFEKARIPVLQQHERNINQTKWEDILKVYKEAFPALLKIYNGESNCERQNLFYRGNQSKLETLGVGPPFNSMVYGDIYDQLCEDLRREASTHPSRDLEYMRDVLMPEALTIIYARLNNLSIEVASSELKQFYTSDKV